MTFHNADEIRRDRETYYPNDPMNPNQLSLIIDEINERIGIFKKEIYEIGFLLTDAKKIVGHSNFQEFIENEFDFSYQTANNFMNVYRFCIGRPQLTYTFKNSVLYEIASPKFPEDLRAYLFEHGEYLEEIDNKTIKNICKRYKPSLFGN